MLIMSPYTNQNIPKASFNNHKISFKKAVKLTDENALKLLNNELQSAIPQNEIAVWMKKIKQICVKFNIKPKDLPINQEHPGNLSLENRDNIFIEIFYSIFNDTKIGKIELINK